jgi:hypothetical protein
MHSWRWTALAACLALAGGSALRAQAATAVKAAGAASSTALPLKLAPRPTVAAITAADLMTRLYIFADDSMLGRAAGTMGNVRGTNYIAREAKRIGLVPAGEAGTYFQTVPLRTRRPDTAATLTVGGTPLAYRADYVVLPSGQLPFGADFQSTGTTAVFAGRAGDTTVTLKPEQVSGKLVVLSPPLGRDGRPSFMFWQPLRPRQYAGAAAVAFATLDITPPQLIAFATQPSTSMVDPQERRPTMPLGLLLSGAAVQRLFGRPLDQLQPGDTGAVFAGQYHMIEAEPAAPARNVVAILPGSDPKLKGEYVALGAHNDHLGMGRPVPHDSLEAFNRVMRPAGAESQVTAPPTPEQAARIRQIRDSLAAIWPERIDSISNGADDDGTGTVSVLEIAQKLAAGPRPKRSVLFVWHTGEELGLLGSTWFTDHPTVPRDSIVAQLNIDMIGRGEGEGEAGVRGDVGVIGARRLSTELGQILDQVNARHHLVFDPHLDQNGDPHQYYCRSDHYEYARYGIPVAFFFTGAHQDYHQLTDEPQYINYPHMAKIANMIADLATAVANLDHRVVVDHPKPDPNGRCVQ